MLQHVRCWNDSLHQASPFHLCNVVCGNVQPQAMLVVRKAPRKQALDERLTRDACVSKQVVCQKRAQCIQASAVLLMTWVSCAQSQHAHPLIQIHVLHIVLPAYCDMYYSRLAATSSDVAHPGEGRGGRREGAGAGGANGLDAQVSVPCSALQCCCVAAAWWHAACVGRATEAWMV
jgi:hypothetical protein